MMSAGRWEIAFLKLGGIEGPLMNSRRRGGQDCPPYVLEAQLRDATLTLNALY